MLVERFSKGIVKTIAKNLKTKQNTAIPQKLQHKNRLKATKADQAWKDRVSQIKVEAIQKGLKLTPTDICAYMASQDLKKIKTGEMESEDEEEEFDIKIRKDVEREAKRREKHRKKWKSTEMEEMYPDYCTKKYTLIESKSSAANEEESISVHDSHFDQE